MRPSVHDAFVDFYGAARHMTLTAPAWLHSLAVSVFPAAAQVLRRCWTCWRMPATDCWEQSGLGGAFEHHQGIQTHKEPGIKVSPDRRNGTHPGQNSKRYGRGSQPYLHRGFAQTLMFAYYLQALSLHAESAPRFRPAGFTFRGVSKQSNPSGASSAPRQAREPFQARQPHTLAVALSPEGAVGARALGGRIGDLPMGRRIGQLFTVYWSSAAL